MTRSLLSARVAIVSGKGGVGKTTVAAALAVAAADAGKRVLLLEVEGRNAIAPLFGIPSLGYAERLLFPNLRAEAVIPDEALVEYLYMFYGIKRIGRALANTKAVDFATNVAPGLRDILLIGKVKEAERRRVTEAYAFDLVVVDAPPTGRLPRFLDAPRAVTDLVHAGPIRTQAAGVLDMITDPKRLNVILVALPGEMPARETEEALGRLEQMGVAVGPIVVNRVVRDRFPREAERELIADARATLGEAARRSGVAVAERSIEAVAAVASAEARRARSQRAILAHLKKATGRALLILPALYEPSMGLPQLRHLADVLREQGATG